MYLPELLVVTLREFLVERSVRVTAASEITAPDTSLTVPSTVPLLVDCALAGRAMPRQRTSVNNANIARREQRASCTFLAGGGPGPRSAAGRSRARRGR